MAERHDFAIAWHPFSLWLKNGESIPGQFRASSQASLAALRVAVAIADRDGNDAVGRFYTERGTRLFSTGSIPPVSDVLVAAGLAPGAAAAADDESIDEAVRRSMEDAMARAGVSAGSPVIGRTGGSRALFGPVLGSLPSDDAGDRIWDAVSTLLDVDEFHELKRDRAGRPETSTS